MRECPTCEETMERKIDMADRLLDWCPTCGTVVTLAADLPDHQETWIPLRNGLQPLRLTKAPGSWPRVGP